MIPRSALELQVAEIWDRADAVYPMRIILMQLHVVSRRRHEKGQSSDEPSKINGEMEMHVPSWKRGVADFEFESSTNQEK